MSLILWK